MSLKTFSKGGVHPSDNKISNGAAIEVFPLTKRAYIPLSQSLGAPSVAVVAKGDTVKVGQLIAKGEAFVSSNIHSPFSGTVFSLDTVYDVSGYKKPCIVIDVEGDEWIETIDRSSDIKRDFSATKEEIIAKIKEHGVVGMGGATFPTHIKLMPPPDKKAEILIINGVECEPYLTADHRLMLEHGEEILIGTSILMKALNVHQAVIGIENNKKDAIEHLKKLAVNYQGITIQALKLKYPQGAEKQLIKAITKREVPSGKLPIEVGAVVNNLGSTFAVYEALQKNKPLIDRVVTVTGKSVKKPSNFLVRLGTPISEIIEAAGGYPEDTGKIISGGPMMGKALVSIEAPVTKGTSGVLLMNDRESFRNPPSNCIRCAKCVDACPMGLEPYLLSVYAQKKDFEVLEKHYVMDCIECGCCQFTCPTYQPLIDWIRVGKAKVGQIIRSRTAK